MNKIEYYACLCVRSMWNEEEQQSRRQGAAAMQERLLLSIVSKSVESVCEAGLQSALNLPDHARRQARFSRQTSSKPSTFQSTALQSTVL